jgi:hypothetical protein
MWRARKVFHLCILQLYSQTIDYDKRSSLVRIFVNNGRKEFYNIGPWSLI